MIKNVTIIATGRNTSLPVFIKISQYNEEWSKKTNPADYGENLVTGSMGDQQFEFFIDCRHMPLNEAEETEAMKKINNKLKSQKNPTFTKKYLLDDFYIIEVADFGRQSMSARYRDFVPHVYYNGKKIFQKYIGIMKYYLTGSAYILIDKAALNDMEDDDDNPYNNIKIIAYQKNNIENSFDQAADSRGKVYIDEDVIEYTFQQKATDKYIISDLDAGFVSNISFKNNGNIIEKQYEGTETEYDDYFKASYIKDYLPIADSKNSNEKFNRKADADYTIEYSFGNGVQSGNNISIKSKENNYDALYCKINGDRSLSYTLDVLKGKIGISNPEEINLFSNNGKLIYGKDYYYSSDGKVMFSSSINTNIDIEIIPAYSDHTKINKYVSIDSNDDFINKLKTYAYRHNYRNFSEYSSLDYLIYDSNGLLVNTINSSENYNLELYNINKRINEVQAIPATDGISDIDIPSSLNNDISWFKNNFYFNDSNSVTNKANVVAAPGILVYNSGMVSSDLEILLIARCFPVKMEKYRLADNMVLFVAPEFLLDKANNELSNSVEKDVIILSHDNSYNYLSTQP